MINVEKIKNLILYLTSNSSIPELGKTKLYKLFFFIDSSSYKEFGNKITGDKYLKFPMGPVPLSVSSVLHEMEANSEILITETLKGNYFITVYNPQKTADMSVFSKNEHSLIDKIISKYGAFSRKQLIDQSHKMESWIKADDYAEIDFSDDNIIPSAEAFVEEYGKDIKTLSRE